MASIADFDTPCIGAVFLKAFTGTVAADGGNRVARARVRGIDKRCATLTGGFEGFTSFYGCRISDIDAFTVDANSPSLSCGRKFAAAVRVHVCSSYQRS
ncbi:hypothetical protein D3C87_1362520 [compost metagenome]